MSNAMKGADPVSEVSTLRLYLLRGMYTFMFVGLAIVKWPAIFNPPPGLSNTGSVVGSVLLAISFLAVLGIQGAQQIGYAWQTQLYKGHTVTFKNGLTGGFTGKIVLDRSHHRAVIVLSNTAAQVDDAANGLLVGDQAWVSSR